jgi:putative ABC transport system permease protein
MVWRGEWTGWIGRPHFQLMTPRTHVPLAWRNMLADRKRLIRSVSGIGFAVLLMLLQLGFRVAFIDSSLEILRNLDGDIFIVSATKFRFGRKDPFPRRYLYASRGVEGVQSARPIYGEWMNSFWKNPQTKKTHIIQVLAFDPDQPVFLFPEVKQHLDALRQPDTALFDTRGRDFVGQADDGTVSELARRRIRVVGTFALGPDFITDGTVITSDRTFLDLFSASSNSDELTDVEIGVVKVRPGFSIENVQASLRNALPKGVAVLTRDQLFELEKKFQNDVSPVGPIFMLGTAIGFVVGMVISYQILYTDLSDQIPQYATLKAMGYENSYLVRVVLQQAFFYAVVGFIPAWLVGIGLFHAAAEVMLVPMRMSLAIALGCFVLTVAMCILSGVFAVRRVMAANPADLF